MNNFEIMEKLSQEDGGIHVASMSNIKDINFRKDHAEVVIAIPLKQGHMLANNLLVGVFFLLNAARYRDLKNPLPAKSSQNTRSINDH